MSILYKTLSGLFHQTTILDPLLHQLVLRVVLNAVHVSNLALSRQSNLVLANDG